MEMHAAAASAPDNKMAADLCRRGRRVPARLGNGAPAADRPGNRLILTSALRSARSLGTFVPKSFGCGKRRWRSSALPLRCLPASERLLARFTAVP